VISRTANRFTAKNEFLNTRPLIIQAGIATSVCGYGRAIPRERDADLTLGKRYITISF
jgi:hypothetical protein